jgi:dTDP-4-amino-4,6-dideoxygalactose transaminase
MSVLTHGASRGPARESVMMALADAHIEARPFFTPLPALPLYASRGITTYDVAVARDLHARGISIPSSASLDHEQQDRVANVLLSIV